MQSASSWRQEKGRRCCCRDVQSCPVPSLVPVPCLVSLFRMVTVSLSFHAAVRDRLGLSEIRDFCLCSRTWSSSAALLSHLCEEDFPALRDLRPSLVLAINEQYSCSSDPVLLSPGDRIALIPPITGG